MTVKELIEKLKEFDENLPVYVNDNMGGGYPVSDMISEKEFIDGRSLLKLNNFATAYNSEHAKCEHGFEPRKTWVHTCRKCGTVQIEKGHFA